MLKLKRLFVMILSFTIIFSMVTVPVDATKKVYLNKSNLSLYVGNTYMLKVKNNKAKVKWSSSRKSVATVTSNGKVKAKKKGTCKVTAKVGGKNYPCKVTVKKKSSTSKKHVSYVYVTDTGSKYHRNGCRYLWNSKRKVTLSSAKAFGYTACSVCW